MTKILDIQGELPRRHEVFEWLTAEGYEVVTAESGVLGVAAALHFLPDLIVCDVVLPGLDGFGVLLELRANPITVGIPFIFVTTSAAQGEHGRGMASEADDFITIPFSRIDLLQAIQSRLQWRSVQARERQGEVAQLQQALVLEREKHLLKGKLVAMFSHDFRNPLTTILSSNTLLTDYSDLMDEDRRRAHRSRINASVRKLVQMLDDLLLTMQMDTGNLSFRPLRINPERLFQGIADEFQAIYGDTHRVIFASRFPEDVVADSRLLQPIAANLISNAIKYSPPGSDVRVTLDSSEDRFTLTVHDQGVGIPEADQARLFAAFERGSNVGQVPGTGLGLAIVKQAADMHGGSIHLESQVNFGTRVSVTIPIAQGSATVSAPMMLD